MMKLAVDIYSRIITPDLFNPYNVSVIAENTTLGWTLTDAYVVTFIYFITHISKYWINKVFIRRPCKATRMFTSNESFPPV